MSTINMDPNIKDEATKATKEQKLEAAKLFYKAGGRMGWLDFCTLSPSDQDIFVEAFEEIDKVWRNRLACSIVACLMDPENSMVEAIDDKNIKAKLKLRKKVEESIERR